MSQTPGDVAQRLLDHGLITTEQLAYCRDSLGSTADDDSLLKMLVSIRRLTKWQAKQIKSGRARSLVVDHYRLLEPLGSGGMGQVYRAVDLQRGRNVALKVLSRRAATRKGVERFRREADVALRVQHQHIVRTYELGQVEGAPFLVMELVEGATLRKYLRKKGALSWREAARIGYEVALGLEHARKMGIIHRDIKPSNILLTRRGRVKLADLGLAKFFGPGQQDGDVGMTRTGALLGTIDYMAPEQADDARKADTRSDVYSLGCTLYHCLTGRPPFDEGTDVRNIVAHRELEPVGINELNPGVPPALAELIHTQMLAKRPEERFQTPAQVAEALRSWAKGSKGLGDSVLLALLQEDEEAAEVEGRGSTSGRRSTRSSGSSRGVSAPPRTDAARSRSRWRTHRRRRWPYKLLLPGSLAATGLVLASVFLPGRIKREAAPPAATPIEHAVKEAPTIVIDGEFSDWAGIATHTDPMGDQHDTDHNRRGDTPSRVEHPDVDILQYKLTHDAENLYAYFKARGVIGRTQRADDGEGGGRYYAIVVLDVDDKKATGSWLHEGGFYPTSRGYDVGAEIEWYNGEFNTGHYVSLCCPKAEEVRSALRDQSSGQYQPGTDGPYPAGVLRLGRGSSEHSTQWVYHANDTITFVSNKGPVVRGVVQEATSLDGHELEMKIPIKGFLVDPSGNAIVAAGATLNASFSLEASGELAPAGVWASDTAPPIRRYTLVPPESRQRLRVAGSKE